MRSVLAVLFTSLVLATSGAKTRAFQKESRSMQLGTFSVSLAVKNIATSRAFYEALGFSRIGGDEKQNWLIMANDTATIGLFQGMFEGNIMTFNPGWKAAHAPAETFTDVREIQETLRAKGLKLTKATDEHGAGPASITLVDPDGNAILVDQHVPRPRK